jgi:hypothetical protein
VRRRLLQCAPLCLLLLPASPASEETALRDKAAVFRQRLEDHWAPEGVVLYRLRRSRTAQELESGRYPELADTPTFTGILAALSCARARVPGEREGGLADARRAIAGVRTLMEVTGRRGLLARAIRRDAGRTLDDLHSPEDWHPAAPPHQRYVFRGNVSQDQYANGLLFAVASCRDLLPDLAAPLAVDFAAHLLENGLRIVDVDGEATRFGDLRPLAAFGWNSVAQLTAYAAFALAEELEPAGPWRAAREELRDRWRVVARSRITNLRVLGITNHSNDLMTLHLLYALLPIARASSDPAYVDLRHALRRTWLRARRDGNPYFAALACHAEPESCDHRALADGLALLERFPLDKTRHALDPLLESLPLRLIPGRKGARLARETVPIELRPPSSFEWKSSPYRVEGSVDPDLQYTGLDYLAAYWLYRALPGAARAR